MTSGEHRERRTYEIDGEKTPTEWGALISELGSAGLSVVRSEEFSVDAEVIKDAVISKDDFNRAFDTHYGNNTRMLVGKTWNRLEILYDVRINGTKSRFYSMFEGELEGGSKGIPIVFENLSKEDNPYWHTPEVENKVLRLDSVEDLLQKVDESIKKYGKSHGIRMVMGSGIGIGVVRFLRTVVQDKYRELEE